MIDEHLCGGLKEIGKLLIRFITALQVVFASIAERQSKRLVQIMLALYPVDLNRMVFSSHFVESVIQQRIVALHLIM